MFSSSLLRQVHLYPCITCALLLPLTALADDNAARRTQEFLGWVPEQQLTPAQRAQMPPGCCGMFVEPTIDTASEDAEINGDATQATEDHAVITGNVTLRQGNRSAASDRIEVFDQQHAGLDGNVLFREPGFLVRGDHADIDLDSHDVSMTNADYAIISRHLHGHAASIERHADGIVTLSNNSYSSCTPGDELWFLKSSTMTLNPNTEQGYATNVRFVMLGVPVFYFPYMQFPIGGQRQSGLLPPTVASGKDGLDITVPYYLNLAPNYDATLSPRSIADRGTGIGVELRGMSDHTASKFNLDYLPDDHITNHACTGTILPGQTITPECNEQNRWMLALNETGGTRQPWFTLVDYTRVSDQNYLADFDKTSLSTSQATYLKQQGRAGFLTDNWEFAVDVEQFQMLQDASIDDPYKKLPELSATGSYYLGDGFSTMLDQRYAKFNRNDSTQSSGDRLAGNYEVDWTARSSAGYIKPSVDVYYLYQQLQSTAITGNPEIIVPAAGLDMGLVFERSSGQSTQLLEPRLAYYYTPYKNQDNFNLFDTAERSFSYDQVFDPNRFSGSDRIADTDQVSLGVVSRWLDAASGHEWLSVGVDEAFYNKDRRVSAFDSAVYSSLPLEYRERYTEARSPVTGEVQWRFLPDWRMTSDLAYDTEQGHADTADVFFHYSGPTQDMVGDLFSVGVRHIQLLVNNNGTYELENDRQAELSTFWQASRKWTLIARADYDLANNHALVTEGGFLYESCCVRLSAVYREWAVNPSGLFNPDLQKENGLYFEIQFKSLAGVGTKMDSLLQDSIYGYNQKYRTTSNYPY